MIFIRTAETKVIVYAAKNFRDAAKWCVNSGDTRILQICSQEKETKRGPKPIIVEAEFENEIA